MNQLEQLRRMTTVVADTGDIEAIRRHRPQDATTNPSLIFKAAQMPAYHALVADAVKYGKSKSMDFALQMQFTLDKLAVNFGMEILELIPGRVSTEVDVRLSFDTKGMIKKARDMIRLYEKETVDRERILIKIASTWEGMRAAEVLEKESIHCNLTLMFAFEQAVACAQAGVTLISPFVGRILDWYKKMEGVDGYPAEEDPGVRSVRRIYRYYRKHDVRTEVMGASFRNISEIQALAGCDLLTISPQLMAELEAIDTPLQRALDPESAAGSEGKRVRLDEKKFRWRLNENAMATEKLAEGIRGFTKDTLALERYIQEICSNC